ncbi:MAG: hypothetical protein ABEI86_02610, partial [Halobacteriaceae archaeon]
VVKETPAGFFTKGDNNPVTDQATGLQPVDRSQIVGEVLTIGGTPIIIPHLGMFLGVFKSIQDIVIAGLLLVFTYSFLTTNESNQRPTRHVIKSKDIYRAAFIGVAIIGISFILLSASTAGFAYTVPQGGDETTIRTYYIQISKSPITNSIIVVGRGSLKSIDQLSHAELEQIKSQDTKQVLPTGLRNQREADLVNLRTTNVYKVWVEVPQTQDHDLVSIRVYTHPALLPTTILRRLHHIHAFIAAVASVGSVLVPLYIIYRIFVDKARPLRFRSEFIRSYLGGNSQ